MIGPGLRSGPSRRPGCLARPKSVILGVPSAVEQDVGRLQVAVDDARARGPRAIARASVRRPAAAASPAASGVPASLPARLPPSHVLQREERQAVVLADLVDLHDVRVLQPGDRLRLGAEAGSWSRPRRGCRPGSSSGRTRRFRPDLPGLVDDAHAAAAQLLEQLVARHLGQGRVARRRFPAGTGALRRKRRAGGMRRGPVESRLRVVGLGCWERSIVGLVMASVCDCGRRLIASPASQSGRNPWWPEPLGRAARRSSAVPGPPGQRGWRPAACVRSSQLVAEAALLRLGDAIEKGVDRGGRAAFRRPLPGGQESGLHLLARGGGRGVVHLEASGVSPIGEAPISSAPFGFGCRPTASQFASRQDRAM